MFSLSSVLLFRPLLIHANQSSNWNFTEMAPDRVTSDGAETILHFPVFILPTPPAALDNQSFPPT